MAAPAKEHVMSSLPLAATLAVLELGAGLALAEPTRVEVTSPTTKDDARPDSDAVPGAYAIPAQFQRVVILRLKHDADLLGGLDKMVKDQKIRNAVILSGIGSVSSYHFHCVSNRTFPSKNAFVKDPAAPADLVAMNGYVIGGRVHAHVTFANDQRAFGGHLEPETRVFTFAIVTLGILGDDVDLSRVDDKAYR
jgi:predicted DNA-binding protein with PD1-like motif